MACDLVAADLGDAALDSLPGGRYRGYAFLCSLCALVVLCLGMRLGFRGRDLSIRHLRSYDFLQISTVRVFALYIGVSFMLKLLSALPVSESLQQPLVGLYALRLVSLYILTAQLKRSSKGAVLILGVLASEAVIGITSFIASYQPAVLTMAAALMTPGRVTAFSITQVVLIAVVASIILWISLVWTAIKPEYRAYLSSADLSTSQRLGWIVDKLTTNRIDYAEAAKKLVQRFAYTEFYAISLARSDAGLVPDLNLWFSAIKHVLTPRVLFPDKAALDDTAVTSQLTGLTFGVNTSVSLGYVAEAQLDFGFPLMLAPILALGFLLGSAARFFLSNDHGVVQTAFCAACLAGSFRFEDNINKSLGGFLITFLVLSICYTRLSGKLMQLIRDRKQLSLDDPQGAVNLERLAL